MAFPFEALDIAQLTSDIVSESLCIIHLLFQEFSC